MKLSLTRKFGWTHVIGGRLLEVAKPHAVHTTTLSAYADDPSTNRMRSPSLGAPAARPSGAWVYCEEGDIAIELLFAKTGKLLGHSYLSGPAINLNRYTETGPGWFRPEPMTGVLVEVPQPETADAQQDFMELLIRTMNAVRFGPADVYAFEFTVDGDSETAGNAAKIVGQCWGYVPKDMTDAEIAARGRSHTMGFVKASEGGGSTLHLQPKRHASDYCATGFQIGLVLCGIRSGCIAEPQEDKGAGSP